MLKALTFIGLRKYDETTYIKHDGANQTCETDLFPEAVAELYKPDQIIAFTTKKVKSAKKDDLERLARRLGTRFCINDIPDGNSTTDLWEIFKTCADSVKAKDEIILDITHAFRSIPLLVFIVAAYLRQVKGVTLKHIIYGAFEARDVETNQTPIFDLTPFVELLDWMNAVNVFQCSGDARPIAGLKGVGNIKDSLTTLSDALLTNRTLEAQQAVSRFTRQLTNAQNLSRQPAPFHILTDQLKDTYQEMSVNKPNENPKESLKAQYVQIKWYVENQHYLQAITLIREWLISWEFLQTNPKDPGWLGSENRKSAEKTLNNRFRAKSKNPLDKLWGLVWIPEMTLPIAVCATKTSEGARGQLRLLRIFLINWKNLSRKI